MTNVTPQLVRTLIEQQFPELASLQIVPVEPGGWDNRTCRLGDEMAVRLPSAECYAAQIQKEQRWLPWLAPQLPFDVPVPLALGAPGACYPWHWSIQKWIEGDTVSSASGVDLSALAADLARFLATLQKLDATSAPAPGAHNFHRGGALSIYDEQTRRSIEVLTKEIDATHAIKLWNTALSTSWDRAPVINVDSDQAAGCVEIQHHALRYLETLDEIRPLMSARLALSITNC